MYKNLKILGLFLLILAILLNINWLNSPILGISLSLVYFLIFGYLLGKIILPNLKLNNQIIMGLFSLISLYSLIGAGIYFVYQLNSIIISLLFLIISSLIIFNNLTKPHQTSPNFINFTKPHLTSPNIILIITYLLLTGISFYTLWQSQTTQPINSPWQVITPVFFIIYSLATINLLLLIFYNKNFLSNIFITIHFALTTSIALIVYQLGYGFDPFIHQATEQAIWQNGFILPKPFYYLGQYSLVVFLAHLLQISVELIDILLVPIILTIFLPYTIYLSLLKSFNWPKYICRLLSLSFLFLPFSLFIVTNPQALANIFTIILVFLSFLYLKNKQISFYYLAIIGLTTLLIHPISGLPVLIYLIIIWLLNSELKFKKYFITGFVLISSIILPTALYLNSLISIYKIKFDWQNLQIINWATIFSKQYNFFLDLAYIYQKSIYIIFLIIVILVFIKLIKDGKGKIFIGCLLSFIILIINAYLLKIIKVDYIIANEQNFFSDRVWQLAFYFLLPLFIYGYYLFLKKASAKNFLTKSFSIIITVIILTCSVYISYPRYDDYDNSKFVNLSQYDLAVVDFIEKDSQNDYIVLAHQMTSAAALKKFGFARYYNEHYFYPIPTGGPLYEYFLKMVEEETSKQTMINAMELTGVNTAYFVLPTYWGKFTIINEKAKSQADFIYELDDQYIIYKFINY